MSPAGHIPENTHSNAGFWCQIGAKLQVACREFASALSPKKNVRKFENSEK
jgi:hypothetical protein